MDFRWNADNTTTGGQDGCINFFDPDNIGLRECLYYSNVQSVYAMYCERLSLADFLVIISEAVIFRTEPNYNASTIYGSMTYSDTLHNRFRKGRTTNYNCG